MTTDWQRLFFDPEAALSERLLARARKRFGSHEDGEAAYNYALQEISRDNWQRLTRGYAGRGKPEAFLCITFVNLLEEYAVRKYGRKRPPAWVRRAGEAWCRIYELLCLKRLLPESIVERLTGRQHMTADAVRSAIEQVRSRIPDCGQYDVETLAEGTPQAAPQAQPPAALGTAELGILLEVLAGAVAGVEGNERPAAAVSRATLARLAELRDSLTFSAEERLTLHLVYAQGHSVAAAARALSEPEHRVRAMHARTLARLRDALRGLGFES
ncbi:MAG: hypothetical protein AAFN78_12925 [Pseudomonadota bacterium]